MYSLAASCTKSVFGTGHVFYALSCMCATVSSFTGGLSSLGPGTSPVIGAHYYFHLVLYEISRLALAEQHVAGA